MKNKIHTLTLSLLTLLVLSCSKGDGASGLDYTQPENLAGTLWESPGFPNTTVEYAQLNFGSSSTVQGLSKREGEDIQVDWNAVFSIQNDSIFISYEGESLNGRISGTDMFFTGPNAAVIRFSLQ